MKNSRLASLWQDVPPDMESRLRQVVGAALERAGDAVYVFFRADDVAVPGRQFEQLIEIFSCRRTPLNLAVVPAWLTRPRWRALNALGAETPHLWCWHQHGWRHANHEAVGKKQEFGPARTRRHLEGDLANGRRRLEKLMGGAFYPAFTPPWNRCDSRTLDLLYKNGYRAISRSRGSRPSVPAGMGDLPVNVDLHTRREKDPADGWQGLLTELETALKNGLCGVMIHHQRMNPAAFEFLDLLLRIMAKQKIVRPVHFKSLMDLCETEKKS